MGGANPALSMTNVTICIPVGNYHADIAEKALASARAQTVSCAVLMARDTGGRGAGVARNRALERVRTAFTVWLDADDWIEPDFVEKCLQAWQPGRYVYTDWDEDGVHKPAPKKPFVDGSWHCITTLTPTAYLRHIGGFDETMPGGEDSALFMALMDAGVCGLRVPEPLFHYGRGGERGKTFYYNPQRDTIMLGVRERYKRAMACCGDNPPVENLPVGEQQPGDVLAMAIWGGNRTELGRATGRVYPRTGNGKTVWVDPRDVQKRPDLWRVVEQKVALPPVEQVEDVPAAVIEFAVDEDAPHGVAAIADKLWPNLVRPAVSLEVLQATAPAEVKPNVSKVRKLARNGKNAAK
jgi:hypothetical protein